ncbi:MAG: YegS/Rv2252/BmrU family lipid kinase [Oscillospiraceae bacterium]|nr:YegS/Rv2252/BmrU family lipid kinase [Oscillospiraceae bacterium]
MRNMMLVVNPFSGRGLSKSALGTIVSLLCESGCGITVYYAGEEDPETLVLKNAKNHELVICVGGDGTLSAVISGLLRSSVNIPVGYIPTGTANDVATTLALSKNPAEAVKTILNGVPNPLDIGLFSGKYFTYIAAFGAFTGVAYKTQQSAKRALGHFAYVLGGVAEVFSIKSRRVIFEYDAGIIEGDYIFGGVMNSKSIAGMVKIDSRHVDLADGMFEVILVKQPIDLPSLLDTLGNIITQTYNSENVLMLHTSRAKFSFEEDVPWTIDGEDGGLHKNVDIINYHEAINIMF